MTIADELIAVLGYDIRGEQNLTRWQRSIDGAEKKLAMFAAAAARYGAIVGAAVGAGMVKLGKDVISTSAQFEKFEATLTTIEGSSVKAKASMDWIVDFAKSTPYEVTEITEAFVRLKSYGIDPTTGALKAIGDVSSAMGKPMMMGVEAIADAASFSFERLREFGITAKQEGDRVTFSWVENGKAMTQEVAKRGDEVTKFLTENFRRFDGAMDLQSRTYEGIVSNLSDTWTQFLRQIGDAGFFDFVKNQLTGLKAKLDQWAADGTLDKWATRISTAFIAVSNAILAVFDRIITHGEFIGKWLAGLDSSTLYAIAAAVALLVVWAWPAAWAFIALAAAIDDLLTYLEGGESKFGDFVAWIQNMTGASRELATALAAIVGSLALMVALKPLGLLKGIGNFMLGMAGGAAGEIGKGGVGQRTGGLVPTLGKYLPIIAGLAGITSMIASYGPEGAKAGARAPTRGSPAYHLGLDATESREDRYYRLMGEGQSSRGGPSSRGRYRSPVQADTGGDRWLRRDAAASANEGGGAIAAMLANMNANLGKMTAGAAAGATITDARQDNRTFPVNVGVGGVTVNVAGPAAAPGATGAAVGAAVGNAAASSAGRMQSDPAF